MSYFCSSSTERNETADDKLVEIIGSTFSGSHFLLCILLGCGTRFVCSHADSVRQFFFMDDPPYVFDSAFDWFSVNVSSVLYNEKHFFVSQIQLSNAF
jgi:hypothetical protein